MADGVKRRVGLQDSTVGAVQGKATVEGMMHSHVAGRRATRSLAHEVKVHRVSPAHVGLAHAIELHIGQVQARIGAFCDDVAAVPVGMLVGTGPIHLELPAVLGGRIVEAVGKVSR